MFQITYFAICHLQVEYFTCPLSNHTVNGRLTYSYYHPMAYSDSRYESTWKSMVRLDSYGSFTKIFKYRRIWKV